MKHYDTMTGYKATNAEMECHGFKYELGKWYKHEGEIKLCEKGFHFCKYPSGPWSFYSQAGTRIFTVEAKNVFEEYEPGAGLKFVCSEIRLIEEIKFAGYMNTGHSNTSNRNAGYRNTGHSNTGDMNTGHSNTGHSNTGHSNTGNRNAGYMNTGHGNATNFSAGFFCQKEPLVISFDKQTKLTRKQFAEKYPEINTLAERLSRDDVFDYAKFKSIPGWTLAKCKALHEKHIAGRTLARKDT
jgi:hypothetical protein